MDIVIFSSLDTRLFNILFEMDINIQLVKKGITPTHKQNKIQKLIKFRS